MPWLPETADVSPAHVLPGAGAAVPGMLEVEAGVYGLTAPFGVAATHVGALWAPTAGTSLAGAVYRGAGPTWGGALTGRAGFVDDGVGLGAWGSLVVSGPVVGGVVGGALDLQGEAWGFDVSLPLVVVGGGEVALAPMMGLPFEAGVRRTTWPGGRVRLGLAWFVPTLTVRHDFQVGFVEAGASLLPPLWGGDLVADATPIFDVRAGARFGLASAE